MSYSPPSERHQKPWMKDRPDSNRDSHQGTARMPRLTSSNRPSTAHVHSRNTNKGGFIPKSATMVYNSNKYNHVQSRLKDQMDFHKKVHKQQQSRSRVEGQPVTNSKEPEIYYKPPTNPSQREKNRNPNQAALRRRSSPGKGEAAEDQYYAG